jgi:hypothetical protein
MRRRKQRKAARKSQGHWQRTSDEQRWRRTLGYPVMERDEELRDTQCAERLTCSSLLHIALDHTHADRSLM